MSIIQQNLKRKLLVIAGTISVGIGFVGIFIPILPTTPFLLLAAACYMRSSKRFYNWLIANKFLGVYIKNYIEGKGITIKVKIVTIMLLWIGITSSILFAIDNLIITIVLLIIAAGVTLHISLIKASPKNNTTLRGESNDKT